MLVQKLSTGSRTVGTAKLVPEETTAALLVGPCRFLLLRRGLLLLRRPLRMPRQLSKALQEETMREDRRKHAVCQRILDGKRNVVAFRLEYWSKVRVRSAVTESESVFRESPYQ